MFLNYILIVLGALLFVYGFFPLSAPLVQTRNDPPNYINNISLTERTSYNKNISKTVLLIIDALRLDFVNPDYMPITSELIKRKGCFNKVKVETPTVTLPRIKALTVGNIPQFMDVVMNLASSEIVADSLIHSALRYNKKIVFYGDDTWLKLFPNKFSRFEGTTSFFVRDFNEVDDNVTRNVHLELENNDWDIMILHYLGLDHIGHVYGPFASLIPIKLAEMDNIIHKIFKKISLTNENILLVVTGDHGMKDSGGHGGSTFHETHVPLAIIGHSCDNSSISQSDIPVNLAVLLGLPIPSLAIGKIHKGLLETSLERYMYALHYNSILLKQKDSCCDTLFEEATTNYLEYLIKANHSSALKAVDLYETYLNIVCRNLSQTSVKQNMIPLLISLFIMINTLLVLLASIFFSKQIDESNIGKLLLIGIIFIQFVVGDSLIIITTVFIILNLILLNNIRSIVSLIYSFTFTCNIKYFSLFVIVLHPITFISSSYVEEEHQFWYFIYVMLINFQILYFLRTKNMFDIIISVVCLTTFRFLRTINSTGDKWATYPDLSDWFLKDENHLFYQTFHIFSLILVFFSLLVLLEHRKLVTVHIINLLTLLAIFIFKENESSLVLGRVVWLLILIQLIVEYKYSKLNVWILIITLLLKPYNVILVPYCVISSLHFSKHFNNAENIVFFHVLMGNALYFAIGHSNSLASVDISVGYVGLSEYIPIVVIGQVLCHTYAFPVLCHLLTLHNFKIDSKYLFCLLFCNQLYIFLITSIITFIFKDHLFIWSVFAPKLFIELVHVLFLFVEYVAIEGNNFITKQLKYVKIKNIFI